MVEQEAMSAQEASVAFMMFTLLVGASDVLISMRLRGYSQRLPDTEDGNQQRKELTKAVERLVQRTKRNYGKHPYFEKSDAAVAEGCESGGSPWAAFRERIAKQNELLRKMYAKSGPATLQGPESPSDVSGVLAAGNPYLSELQGPENLSEST